MSQILKFEQELEMKIQHNSNSSMQIYWTFNILRWPVCRFCVSPFKKICPL